ncbi:MAG: fructosamine kinase family protein, partial [Chitinophagales bacterium]
MDARKLNTESIQRNLFAHLHKEITITTAGEISGGCINQCYHIKTNEKDYFLKVNNAVKYPGMFAAEAKGLALLQNACPGFTPEVILQYAESGTQYLILEYLASGYREKNYWQQFAENLTQIHKSTNSYFGLDHHNYIGAIPQINTPADKWSDFFVQCRIEPLLSDAFDKKYIAQSTARKFNKLYSRIENLFPPEKPSLVHGDLWGGNHITGNDGFGKLIDPAVYYGHREMDLAMMHL